MPFVCLSVSLKSPVVVCLVRRFLLTDGRFPVLSAALDLPTLLPSIGVPLRESVLTMSNDRGSGQFGSAPERFIGRRGGYLCAEGSLRGIDRGEMCCSN